MHQMVQHIISYILKDEFEEYLKQITNECSEYILENNKETSNDDSLLNFIVLIDIFLQFENEYVIKFILHLLLNNIISKHGIRNDELFLLFLEIKRIINYSNEFDDEINYIKNYFTEINPYILNEIDINIIEQALKMYIIEKEYEDSFFLSNLKT